MNELCPHAVRPCDCFDEPILNLSAEADDAPTFLGGFSIPVDPPLDREWTALDCEAQYFSTISQADADEQAKAVCVDPAAPPPPPPPPDDPVIELSLLDCPAFTTVCEQTRLPTDRIPTCTYQGQTFVFDNEIDGQFYDSFIKPSFTNSANADGPYYDARHGCWYTAYPTDPGPFSEAHLFKFDDGSWHIFFGFDTFVGTRSSFKSYGGEGQEDDPPFCQNAIAVIGTTPATLYAQNINTRPLPQFTPKVYCGAAIGVACPPPDSAITLQVFHIECVETQIFQWTERVCVHWAGGLNCDQYVDGETFTSEMCTDLEWFPSSLSLTQSASHPVAWHGVDIVEVGAVLQNYTVRIYHRGKKIASPDLPCAFGTFLPWQEDHLDMCGNIMIQAIALTEPVIVTIIDPP